MELVETAAALPAPARFAWLTAQCPDDPDLIAEILDRVAWEEKMGDFLRDPIVARAASREQLFAPGSLLTGRYRISREIGRGRWTVVFEAVDTNTDLRVAIKVGGSGAIAGPSFHEGLVRRLEYAEVETAEGRVGFVVFEYLEGPTLASRLRADPPLPFEQAHATARRLCQVLSHAAASGFQAASLNAGDIILCERGPVLVCDWLVVSNRTNSPAADLMTLGLILRRLAPDSGHPAAPGWARMVRRCLGQSQEPRYASLAALEAELSLSQGVLGSMKRWLSVRR